MPASAHRLHVLIPAPVWEELRARAYRERTSVSALVNAALSVAPAPARIDAPSPPPFVPAEETSTSGGIVGRALERHR